MVSISQNPKDQTAGLVFSGPGPSLFAVFLQSSLSIASCWRDSTSTFKLLCIWSWLSCPCAHIIHWHGHGISQHQPASKDIEQHWQEYMWVCLHPNAISITLAEGGNGMMSKVNYAHSCTLWVSPHKWSTLQLYNTPTLPCPTLQHLSPICDVQVIKHTQQLGHWTFMDKVTWPWDFLKVWIVCVFGNLTLGPLNPIWSKQP